MDVLSESIAEFGGHGTGGVQYTRGGFEGGACERGRVCANAMRAAAAHPLAADASKKARGDRGEAHNS